MKRPTYANIAATLALVVALGGTAYAAGLPRNSVGTPQLKKNAVTTAKIKKDTVTTAKIRTGTVGLSDLSPQALALAATGPSSPAMVSGAMTGVTAAPANGSLTRVGSVADNGPAETSSAVVYTLSPGVALTAGDLSVRLGNDLPDGGSVFVGLTGRDGQAGIPFSIVSCTVFGTSGPDATCTASGTGTIPAGTLLNLQVTVNSPPAASTNPQTVWWGFTTEPAAS